MLSYHGGSYVRAILDLYSELKIDHERLLNKFKSVNIQPSMRYLMIITKVFLENFLVFSDTCYLCFFL